MKIFTVDFSPMWPVPHGLVIQADSKEQAFDIAKKTIEHTEIKVEDVKEYDLGNGVIFYESGDY